MCTVTPRRVEYECTIGTLTTLGECGLSLSLGLRPMKTIVQIRKLRVIKVCWAKQEGGR